jgi:hypothetical protein
MPSCFVIMPITTPADSLPAYQSDKDHFPHVLETLFEPAVAEIGYEVWRPSSKGSDLIHDQIIKQLETADLVLCDMSTLNANVFFELGIRTALDKPVSLLKDEITTRVPFDTAVLNYHTYQAALHAWSLREEISKLTGHLRNSIEGSGGRNTMWRRFGLTIRAGLPEEDNPGEAKLDLLLNEVTSLSRAMDSSAVHLIGDRLGDFFAALGALTEYDLAQVNLEPQGNYTVIASGVSGESIPFRVRTSLTDVGIRHGIKVNFS